MKLAAVGDNCMDVYDAMGQAYPGGNPVNVAVYFVRLGGEASYTGVVGSDGYGALMRSALSKKGVDISHVRTAEGQTAVTHVEIKDGDRVFGDYDEGVLADFHLTAEEIEHLQKQPLVVTGLWGNVHDQLAEIKAGGAKIAFDAATKPDHEAARSALPSVDYLFFSSDLDDSPELRAYMKQLHAQGPELVTVTLGSRGSLCYDGQHFHTFGIVPCEVVDTLGAGDSYIAGFLKGLTDGKPIPECMQEGAACASVTLGYSGAW